MPELFKPQPFFLSGPSANLFAIYYPVGYQTDQAILLVPPFGDEMNKSRRMIRLQAQRFCQMGYAVLIIDLFGTGDSSGEFGAATWDIWRDNLQQAWQWLQEEKNITSIHLWGIRLGALLALDTASTFKLPAASFLFWQPVISGERFVTQLLRLRIAEQFGQKTQETVKSLRERSRSGEELEIAGYLINPTLLQTMANIKMENIVLHPGQKVAWLECASGDFTNILPSSQKLLDHWSEQGINALSVCVNGASFWNCVEIEDVPALMDQSCTLLTEIANEYN